MPCFLGMFLVLTAFVWFDHIWLDDSSLKVICPSDFESGLMQAFAAPVFCHGRVQKCDSCCDDGTGWGGWYQAGRSGVPASWGFVIVPCNIVIGFRQLQSASNCFTLFQTASNRFTLFQTASNRFTLFQTASNSFKLLQTASISFKLLRTASNWFQLFPRKFRGASSCEARDTLLQAARDGRLASAFKEMRKASVSTCLASCRCLVWLRQFDTISFSWLQDQLRECHAFWVCFWYLQLLYDFDHIWLDDSSLKVICPSDFESGLMQAFAAPVFCHGRVQKCDSCCDDGTGWGGWYQAGWSGVAASWGFVIVPCNIVIGFRQLQSASNCFTLFQTASNRFTLFSNCFQQFQNFSKLLQSVSNFSELLQTVPTVSKKVQRGIILRGPGHAAASCPRWPLGIRFQGDAQGQCFYSLASCRCLVWLRQFDTISFSWLQDQLRECHAFWVCFWYLQLLYDLIISDLMILHWRSFVLQISRVGWCKHLQILFFCHGRVQKCDSCCDDGTGWGGWYQAGRSGVPASWGFVIVPCNIVIGFRQLQSASNCFTWFQTASNRFTLFQNCFKTVSHCFKLLQTVSNFSKLLQSVSNFSELLQTGSNCFQESSEGHHLARPGTRCCKLPAMAAWHPLSRRCARPVFLQFGSCRCLVWLRQFDTISFSWLQDQLRECNAFWVCFWYLQLL